MENLQLSTGKVGRRGCAGARTRGRGVLNAAGLALKGLLSALLLASPALSAQTPPHIPPNALAQLQVPQPPPDLSAPVTVGASFDPPTARVGEKIFYRVTVGAPEPSIRWPERIPAPAELKFGAAARGQIMALQAGQFHPLTAFLYELRATAAGRFTVSNFAVEVYGRPVEIPAAGVEVVAASVPAPPPRQLALEVWPTNLYVGQPFRVRVLLPAGAADQVEALREVQLDGDGFMTDKTTARQVVEVVNRNGTSRPAFVYETVATPIANGALTLRAQGFAAGREFSGPIVISGRVIIPGGPPQYDFLVSEAVEIHVRPLPAENELPGFTGAIGKFTASPPQLSANRLRVGQPVQLKMAFRSEGDLARFVPPAPPQARDWQVIPDDPPDNSFTLIPLTDDVRATPPIPFSAFDPATGKFYDLTIPPLPVTVTGKSLPMQLLAWNETGEKTVTLKLSDPAPTPGKTASLQLPLRRGWLVGAQLAPLLGLLALWQWDRRRRFLEAHPEIVRRRRARRALRREKRRLEKAVAAGDAAAFVRYAADALRIASAPHFPAHPRALVCADVLAQLNGTAADGHLAETVRKIFAAADAQFATAPPAQEDWLALESGVVAALQKLEAKL
jgi:hypothetical protein